MYASPREAARLLKDKGCPSYETLRRWAVEGQIKAERFQRYWRIDLDALEQHLIRRRENGDSAKPA